MKESNRGGKREGAGRKSLNLSERMVAKTIRLTPEQLAWLEKSGGVSKTVRQLVTEAMNWPY